MKSNINLIDLENSQKDEFWEKFNKISLDCNNFHAIYNKDFYSYQKEYCISNNTFIADRSFIINNNNKIECAGIFLLTRKVDSNLEINFGSNFPGILIINININSISMGLLKDKISNLLKDAPKISFTIPINSNLNKSYENIFNNFQFTQNINWTKSIRTDQSKDILWRGLRKSYKSPINKGIKKQSFQLIDAFNLDRKKFKLIQELHLKISGRKTRSDRTWDLQYDSIKNDNGFALLSLDQEKNFINNAVYFWKTKYHAYYGTGLYTEHSKKNLYGYSIIWKAILYCAAKGITRCELDDNVQFQGISSLDKKLIDISFFKSGFGGDLFPRFIFSITK